MSFYWTEYRTMRSTTHNDPGWMLWRCRLWAKPKLNLQVELRDEFGVICAGLPCELQLHVQLLGLANLVVQPAGQRRCRNRISYTAIAEL